MPPRNDRGAAMIEFIAGGFLFGTLVISAIQLGFLWAGKGAVETAAHFASRKFAFNARSDMRKAEAEALAEATNLCRNRPGGKWEDATLTTIQFSLNGIGNIPLHARSGEAYKVRLTHGVQLIVPWVNRVLFHLAPVPKMRIDDKYYLLLDATRWVTVE